MSELLRNLVAYDASTFHYRPIIEDAAGDEWRVCPYDNEFYAVEDIVDMREPALVAVLTDDSFAFADFAGKQLLKLATGRAIPWSVIAHESMKDKIEIPRRCLFIPRTPGLVTNELAEWLHTL